MTELIRKAIDRYGRNITVVLGGKENPARGFIQPVTREKFGESSVAGPLGAVDERCWRYIGCAGTPVEPGDTILCGGSTFHVHSAAAEYAGDEISHYWAALVKEVSE